MLTERQMARDTAAGKEKADVVIQKGKLVNVYTGEIYPADIAIKGRRIACIGDVSYTIGPNTRILDARGNYLVPGFIDVHYHVGDGQLSMTGWAETLLKNGSTSVCTDLGEYGIVAGKRGVRFALDEAKAVGLNILFLVPAVAYMQHTPFGNTQKLTEEDMFEMLNWPESMGINEPTADWLVDGADVMERLADETLRQGKLIEGHAPAMSGRRLQAYLATGPDSDHETVAADEAVMKLRLGMQIAMRESSPAPNVEALVKAITEKGMPPEHFSFCSDDRDVVELFEKGHMNHIITTAINAGLEPVKAIQIGTINGARYLRKDNEIGSITPGRLADIVITSDLRSLEIDYVFSKGEVVVENGKYIKPTPKVSYPDFLKCAIHLKRPVQLADLAICTDSKKDVVRVRVLHCNEGSIISERREAVLPVRNGEVLSSVEQDVLKMVVVERHRATGNIGKGFVSGLGLKRGAFAQSYSPAENNIIALGASDESILAAIEAVQSIGGGFVAVDEDGELLASLRLPILGLFSDQPIESVYQQSRKLYDVIHEKLGSPFRSPFVSLGFMAMAYGIPTYKISEYGLVDIETMELLDVIIE